MELSYCHDLNSVSRVLQPIFSFADDIAPQRHRNTIHKIRENLRVLINNTTVVPFKWQSGHYKCFYCGKKHTDVEKFNLHARSHEYCNESVQSLQKAPYIEVKLDVSQVACKLCSEPFHCLSEILDHLIGKHELDYDKSIEIRLREFSLVDLRCLDCQERFCSFRALCCHTKQSHPKYIFICDECGLSCNNKWRLVVHIRDTHRPGGYPCDECSVVPTSLSALRVHQNQLHTEYPSLVSRKQTRAKRRDYECKKSKSVLQSKSGLILHARKCESTFVKEENCDLGNKVNTNQNPDINKIRENIISVLNMSNATPFRFQTMFGCFYCSEKYHDMMRLREHTTEKHAICDMSCLKKIKTNKLVRIDTAHLACKVCSQSIEEFDDLIDHLILEHNANYDTTIKGYIQPFKIFEDNVACPYCPNEVHSNFPSLLNHFNTSHGLARQICAICGKECRNISSHMFHVHSAPKICPICDKTFNNYRLLLQHKSKVHNVKNLQCRFCKESFFTWHMRQKHVIEFHKAENAFKCKHCDASFLTNTFMNKHIQRHHMEKSFSCHICGMMFSEKSSVKRHMVKHVGVRNFSCDICDMKFLWKKNLTLHAKRKHPS